MARKGHSVGFWTAQRQTVKVKVEAATQQYNNITEQRHEYYEGSILFNQTRVLSIEVLVALNFNEESFRVKHTFIVGHENFYYHTSPEIYSRKMFHYL